MPIAVGQSLEVTIEKLSLGGDGIARVASGEPGGPSDFVLFVPFSAPGDRLEVRIIERKKSFGRAKVVRVLASGPDRADPPCPSFFRPSGPEACGGCNFQHLGREGQLRHKTAALRETLQRLAGIPEPDILPALSGEGWGYRNKIQVPFGRDERTGEIVAGFYAPGSHRIVPLNECAIQSEEMMAVLRFVRERLAEWKIEPYSEKRHSGWLRHLFIRQERGSRKMLVAFVTAAAPFPKQREWIEGFQKQFPQVAGILQNVNTERTNVILSRHWRTVFGQDHLIERLDGLGPDGAALELRVSASSFFQVNTEMSAALYKAARDAASEGGSGGTLLDLYCGVGGIGLACAQRFDRVVGVEEAPSSVRDAVKNAELNRFSNAEFVQAEVEPFLAKFQTSGGRLRVVIDPPRAGCSEGVLRQILHLAPDRVVYVSCEPSTLARDIKILSSGGYRLVRVQPVDLFPQSSHLESVSVLEKTAPA